MKRNISEIDIFNNNLKKYFYMGNPKDDIKIRGEDFVKLHESYNRIWERIQNKENLDFIYEHYNQLFYWIERYWKCGIISGKTYEFMIFYNDIDRCTENDYPVLITGETGTGKKLIANTIHKNSKRAKISLCKLIALMFLKVI